MPPKLQFSATMGMHNNRRHLVKKRKNSNCSQCICLSSIGCFTFLPTFVLFFLLPDSLNFVTSSWEDYGFSTTWDWGIPLRKRSHKFCHSYPLQLWSLKGDTKGTFHAKMGSINDRNGRDLTEAEDTKKRWQEYTEERTVQKRSSWPR